MIFDADRVLTELMDVARAARTWEIHLSASMSQMPAGHNGPYFDLETPVRNTAHWLAFYSVLYKLTGYADYKQTADRLFAYLKSPVFPRTGILYTHRQKAGKDRCNGVIGSAWVIEALVRYARYIRSDEAQPLALEIARSLPFESGQAAWRRRDPVEGVIGIDSTYNHQAWFAAAIAEVDPSMASSARAFLDRSVQGAFRVRGSGRINHMMYLRGGRNRAAQVKYSLQQLRGRAGIAQKEDGYHLFVLFALARLKRVFPDHPLFAHPALLKSLRYVATPQFLERLSGSPYAYPYNAPGFELPLIVAAFQSGEPQLQGVDCMRVHDEQRRRTFSDEVSLFVNNCPDPCTLAARVYELALGLEAIAG